MNSKIDKKALYLKQKAKEIRIETLKIHKIAPETRIASSLSLIEILVVLFYGNIAKYKRENICWEDRDRIIISKGHGSIGFYPILADLGYFDKIELKKVGKKGTFLGSIPDCIIPGYETTNGSLGHGLGVACGVSLGLKSKNKTQKIFVLVGDGELYEGSNWEAIMFAGHHNLDNLIVILDKNNVCMLDRCKNIINLEPYGNKFEAFNWYVDEVDGHNIEDLYNKLFDMKKKNIRKPKILIAHTIKGKGVPSLENDSLSHVKSLTHNEIDTIIRSYDE